MMRSRRMSPASSRRSLSKLATPSSTATSFCDRLARRCRESDRDRGEIALRIHVHARDGIRTVAVHSEADTEAKYVKLADESYASAALRRRATSTFRRSSRRGVTDAEAILRFTAFSRDADLADTVKLGVRLIGPRAESIPDGDKVSAKQPAQAGVACVPARTARCGDARNRTGRAQVGYPSSSIVRGGVAAACASCIPRRAAHARHDARRSAAAFANPTVYRRST